VSSILLYVSRHPASAERFLVWEHLFSNLRAVFDRVKAERGPNALPTLAEVDYCVTNCIKFSVKDGGEVDMAFDHVLDDHDHISQAYEAALLSWSPDRVAPSTAQATNANTGRVQFQSGDSGAGASSSYLFWNASEF
jgi:hypothetical protein